MQLHGLQQGIYNHLHILYKIQGKIHFPYIIWIFWEAGHHCSYLTNPCFPFCGGSARASLAATETVRPGPCFCVTYATVFPTSCGPRTLNLRRGSSNWNISLTLDLHWANFDDMKWHSPLTVFPLWIGRYLAEIAVLQENCGTYLKSHWRIQKTELEEASVDCFGHGCERYLQTFTNKWLHRELLLHYLIDRTALPGQSAGRISPFGTLLVRGREASLCGSQVASGDELLPAWDRRKSAVVSHAWWQRDGSLWGLSEIQRRCEVARHIICAWSCYHLGLEIELKPLCWKSYWMTLASKHCKKKILRRQISWPRGSANYRLVATMAHLLYSCHCPKKKLVFVPWSMAKMSNCVCI